MFTSQRSKINNVDSGKSDGLEQTAPVQCKRHSVLLLFCAVFRPTWSSVNVV